MFGWSHIPKNYSNHLGNAILHCCGLANCVNILLLHFVGGLFNSIDN